MSQSNDSGLNLDRLEADAKECLRTYQYVLAEPDKQLELIALARRATLANQPAPTVPAGDALAQLTKERDGWKDEAAHQKALYERACESVEMLRDHERAHFWIWQGDGTDNLNSMTDSMTILMRADHLRAALAHQPAHEQAEPMAAVSGTQALGLIAANNPYFGSGVSAENWQRGFDGKRFIGHAGSDAERWFKEGAKARQRAQQEPVAAPQQVESGLPLDVEFKQLADTILQATTNGARLEALRSMAVLFDKQAAQLDGGQEGSGSNG